MQVSVEAISNLERQLKVSLPTDRIDNEINQRINELKGQVKMPGFRPGKVPLEMIKSRYGSSIRGEVVDKLIRESLHDAFNEQNLQPAGAPNLIDIQAEPGKPLEYTAVFEIYPEISLADLAKFTIDKPISAVTEIDVDEMLSKLQKQHAELITVERAAQQGDTVVIDFVGTMDGKEFEGGKAENMPVEIGSKSLIDGFEEGLIGKKTGDEVSLDLKFPEKYHKSDYADKPVQFKVTVREVKEQKLPELNDDFAQLFNMAEGGLNALRDEIKQNMQRELNFAQRQNIKNQVFEKLIEANEIDLPKSLVEAEAKRMQQDLANELKRRTKSNKLPELPLDNFLEQASKRVKLGLLLAEAIKIHEIKADAQRVREHIEQISASYEQPELMVNWYYSQPEQLQAVEAVVIEDQAIDKLLEQFETKEVSMGYNEVINSVSTR